MQNKDQQNVRGLGQNQYQPLPEGAGAEEEIDIRELFLKLNRRRTAIGGIFSLVIVITWLILSQLTPKYTAETLMVLEFRKTSLLSLDEVFSGGRVTPAVIGTELDILRSASLLERVADELRLERKPEFNPALMENGGLSTMQRLGAWLEGWGSGESAALEEGAEGEGKEISPEEQEKNLKKALVEKLQEDLKVENRRDSYTVSISYTSQNPRLASQVANAVAEMYITDQLEAKFEAARRANEWLTQRLEGLRREVQAAEQAVKNVRQKSDMIQARGGTLLEQQIGDVNAQLIQARLNRSRAEARLAQAREVMDRPGGIETLGEVLTSGVIQQLREEEAALRRKKAELSQRYGPRHPQMIQVDAEMSDLENKIREETSRVLKTLENEVQVARAEERSLIKSLDQLRTEAGRAMEAELQLRELERRAQSSRTLYESYLTRFQETQEQDELQRPNARVISQAEVPDLPSHPRKKRTLALAVVAGLMFGVMGAFLLEALDRGFRTGDQVEKHTGLPVLGVFPQLGRSQGTPLDYVVAKPYSSLAESLRAFRTALQLSNVDRPPQTILVTSAIPKEGKSMFSLALGRMAAMSGSKTLVIDADLRRPVLHKRFPDLKAKARLEDVLQGKAKIEDAIVKDPQTGLCLLMAHGKASTAKDLLGSQRMQGLLNKMKGYFDLIILDTPPFLGVSDAWSLAREVDSVVFLVRWAETPRDTVRAVLQQMKQLEIDVSGIVMSQVNVRRQARYGYGGYGYYYGKYQKYYKE